MRTPVREPVADTIRGAEVQEVQLPAVFAVRLDGGPGSVRAARESTGRFLRELAEHGGPLLCEDTRRDAVLVVAELVGNACRHAPGPCRLTVTAGDRVVDVAVEDTSPRPPVLRPPDPSGYGLRLVSGLARSLDVLTTARGKTVFATVVEG